MADLSWTAPELEYIEVDEREITAIRRLERLTPIVLCSRCGIRYAEDHTRDMTGAPRPEEESDERDREPLCKSCQWEAFGEALEHDTLYIIERRLGLTEENKKTLEALMSIVDNPDRVMLVARVQERVGELERRLEERSNCLEGSRRVQAGECELTPVCGLVDH